MPRALAMPPRSVFRGNVPENDIVVAENYIDDFIAIIDMKKAKRKRRTMKTKTDAKVTNTMTGKKSMQRRAAAQWRLLLTRSEEKPQSRSNLRGLLQRARKDMLDES